VPIELQPAWRWHRSVSSRVLSVSILGVAVAVVTGVIWDRWWTGIAAGSLFGLVAFGFWSAVASGDERYDALMRQRSRR
jgi:hypothetical protein